ncbi:patatin-like phospholipase family protein [Vibrio genomosp. F10 str. 9ZC157]|uniref:Patatin family protein n=1 Tax=Vibrio genomosp. F10 str. ZF-129 TaxID=1187848 RepID=A0A1E5BH66_9VIBR|nr:patatin family protein [Vibrio genomosp. F10]OEE36129.1 patatin family protein [Vibrio genomosp. F10 str. ZF-129]OEE93724.1 patatin family protein [Vibrio genomosp. F10 str. 9ZD137]OEE96877.1 patatin family protein [Vibrio genomosp. F10 str. 9ZC157]
MTTSTLPQKALIVEGGAMRGIFASGVLDSFMDNQFLPYDFAIGVSAGATNLIGYLGHSPKRSAKVITQLATDKHFYSPLRFAKGGNLVDVRWLWEQSNRAFPLDWDRLFHSIPMYAAVTNIETGYADYYHVQPSNLGQVIEATTALPVAYKETPCFSGRCYTDGGVSDSIPVQEAYRRGATEITVILSHPLSYQMSPVKHPWMIKRLLAKYPNIARAMLKRADNYNRSLEFIRNPPCDVQIRVIAPPEDFAVRRLTMNQKTLKAGYEMGVTEGKQHLASLQGVFGLDEENCHFCL